jgi:serine/threonine-protein kinase ULK4
MLARAGSAGSAGAGSPMAGAAAAAAAHWRVQGQGGGGGSPVAPAATVAAAAAAAGGVAGELEQLDISSSAPRAGAVPLADLVWHPSDTAVKPIVGNRRIERLPDPRYEARDLPFQPLGLPEMLDTDQRDLETFLTDIYRCALAEWPAERPAERPAGWPMAGSLYSTPVSD